MKEIVAGIGAAFDAGIDVRVRRHFSVLQNCVEQADVVAGSRATCSARRTSTARRRPGWRARILPTCCMPSRCLFLARPKAGATGAQPGIPVR